MMLVKRIRFIVAMVSCSLLGIILLQGYWLYHAYQLSAEQFDQEIRKMAQTLQRKYVAADMKSMGIPLNSEIGRQMTAQDEDRAGEFFQLFHDAADSTHMQRVDQIHHQEDTLKRNRRFMITTSTRDTGNDPATKIATHKTVLYQSFPDPYSTSEFQQLAISMRHAFDSLMQLNRIQTPYALKLSNVGRSNPSYYTDSALFSRLPPRVSRMKIGVLKPFMLDLSLANNTLFIAKKMQWVLLASLIIMGTTAWAFWYMLRTIFQQKRWSAIKNDFFNNMTHEFKTPIATVSLAVEALKNEGIVHDAQRLDEYLMICDHELKRISAMIDKVLKMAAFERSEVSLSFQSTSVKELVMRVITTMQPQITRKQADVYTSFSEHIPPVVMDADHMANVLYNLIENSLKYTTAAPKIKLECLYDGEETLQFTVSDNGIGIPAAYHDKVFENFFRVPTGDIHDVKGFGMGLSYVRTIVGMHQGTIELKSKRHEGSTFIITLPMNGKFK